MVLDKTLERLLDCKEIHLVHPKGNQSWIFIHRKDWCWNSNTFATWWEELTHLKEPWCWESLKVGGERDDKEWDGWMASPTRRTWVWASFGSWWWTGKPAVLQSMGLQSRTRPCYWTELRHTAKMHMMMGGGDVSDVSTSQRRPRIADSPQKLQRSREEFFLAAWRESMVLMTLISDF